MLESDELIWDEESNIIYTEERVKITTKKEIIYGTGFVSDPNFSEYGCWINATTWASGECESYQLVEVDNLPPIVVSTCAWSLGAELEIPDLTGSEQAQALEDLQNLGFKIGIENSADASVPAGSVIRTQPPSNTIVNPDSLVTIIVSVGPEAFPIPYVLDIETERAIYIVEESGFTLGQLLEVNDENIPRGFILSQNPVAGTKMSPGTTVDLVVSKGPSLIEISDLSRKSPEDAIQILETLGFEYELIEEFSEDIEIGLVSGTLPEAGEVVAPDQLIQVIVSLGIKIEIPEVEGLNYEDAVKKNKPRRKNAKARTLPQVKHRTGIIMTKALRSS